MSVARIRDAYAARAGEYIELIGDIDAADQRDREQLLEWAQSISGPIIDVGCGPGQWTDYLSRHDVDIVGIDPVSAFIAQARRRHPDGDYRIGQADQLGADDASLGGVLSWFSLIHLSPDQIGEPLTEFARCTRPGGGLAVGFFEGPELVPFDHAVTTAWFWPIDLLSSRIEQAGFEVTHAEVRTDRGVRRQGTIIARRRA